MTKVMGFLVRFIVKISDLLYFVKLPPDEYKIIKPTTKKSLEEEKEKLISKKHEIDKKLNLMEEFDVKEITDREMEINEAMNIIESNDSKKKKAKKLKKTLKL